MDLLGETNTVLWRGLSTRSEDSQGAVLRRLKVSEGLRRRVVRASQDLAKTQRRQVTPRPFRERAAHLARHLLKPILQRQRVPAPTPPTRGSAVEAGAGAASGGKARGAAAGPRRADTVAAAAASGATARAPSGAGCRPTALRASAQLAPWNSAMVALQTRASTAATTIPTSEKCRFRHARHSGQVSCSGGSTVPSSTAATMAANSSSSKLASAATPASAGPAAPSALSEAPAATARSGLLSGCAPQCRLGSGGVLGSAVAVASAAVAASAAAVAGAVPAAVAALCSALAVTPSSSTVLAIAQRSVARRSSPRWSSEVPRPGAARRRRSKVRRAARRSSSTQRWSGEVPRPRARSGGGAARKRPLCPRWSGEVP